MRTPKQRLSWITEDDKTRADRAVAWAQRHYAAWQNAVLDKPAVVPPEPTLDASKIAIGVGLDLPDCNKYRRRALRGLVYRRLQRAVKEGLLCRSAALDPYSKREIVAYDPGTLCDHRGREQAEELGMLCTGCSDRNERMLSYEEEGLES